MESLKNEFEYRFFDKSVLTSHRKEIIDLIEMNFSTNFPNMQNRLLYSNSSFDEMVNYINNDTAIIVGSFCLNCVVGFIWAYRREVFGERRMHISHIAVNSEYREYGIGTKLVEFIEKKCKEDGIKKIELLTTLSNTKTLDFYQKRGFEIMRVQLEKELD